MKKQYENFINSMHLAFTLAEVLIVLGIIGIIAELTIPDLYANFQKQVYITSAKKAYSVLSSATSSLIYDNSGIWDNSSADGAVLSKNMADSYSKYFSYIKKDYIENILTQGWLGYESSTIVLPNNSNSQRYAILLKDGMILRFYSSQNCSSGTTSGYYICGDINLDVNGNKKPNMYGKDVYTFDIVKTSDGVYKILPSGVGIDSSYTCSYNSQTQATSMGCTELVITNQPLPTN